MSDWIPPQPQGAGGDRAVTRQPVKVVVHGAGDNPELHNAVVSEYTGHLNHFYRHQSQQHVIGDKPSSRGHRVLPDAHLIYTNTQGIETLEIKVHPQKLAHLKLDQGHWDWARIDIRIPDMHGFTYAGMAVMVKPFAAPIGTDSVSPFAGTAVDMTPAWGDDGAANPYIAYSNITDNIVTVTVPTPTTGVSSLRVDLRQVPVDMVLEVDLYGMIAEADYFEPTIYLLDYGIAHQSHTEVVTTRHSWQELVGGTLDPPHAPPYDLIDPDSLYIPLTAFTANWRGEVYAQQYTLPGPTPLQFATIGTRGIELTSAGNYGFQTNGSYTSALDYSPERLAPPAGGDPGDTYEFDRFYTVNFDVHTDYQYIPLYALRFNDGPITRTCDLTAVFYKGMVRWMSTLQMAPGVSHPSPYPSQPTLGYDLGSLQFTQWEDAHIYPQRPIGVTFGQVTITKEATSAPYTLAGHYSYPYLGRVSVNRKHGTASFTNAPVA